MTKFDFINLDAFYGLHPELREDQDFQDFLSQINTGKTGFTNDAQHVNFKPEQILDREETARLLGSDLIPHSKGTTLWNYAAQKIEGPLLKQAVQKKYFQNTQVTGNIYADLLAEIGAALLDRKNHPKPTYGIVRFERNYTSLDLIIDLELNEDNRPLYKYYAAAMNVTPEQLHLLLVRFLDGDAYARFTFSDTEKESEWYRLQDLRNQLEAAVESPPEAIPKSQEPNSSTNPPNWMYEVGVSNIDKFIETKMFDFYKSLSVNFISAEDLNSLIEKERASLTKAGCGADFIDNLLSFTPVPEGASGSAVKPVDQIKEKTVQFLDINGYKIFDLSAWINGQKLFLGRASKTYGYGGIATRPQKFSEYQILKTDNKPTEIRADFLETVRVNENTAAVFQFIDFQPELLGPLTQSDEGKKMVEKVFGRPPQMSRDILFEFSKNLQKSYFLLESAEGKSGETDDIERSKQAIIMALGMSSNPSQLFLYLYATSFNLFKSFSCLRWALSQLMAEMALPGKSHANDKPMLGMLATSADYESPETIAKIIHFFDEKSRNAELSANEDPYSAMAAIADDCQAIVQKNNVMANPKTYFNLEEVEIESLQFKTPTAENNSPKIPLIWFEKEAERLDLSADDFKHADLGQDGQINYSEMNFEWSAPQRKIFAAVAKKHPLAMARFLIAAGKQNESSPIPLDILTKGQARILLRNETYNSGSIPLAGEKIPLTVLRRALHADRKENYQETVQALQSRYPHRAAHFYNQENLTDVELIQKMKKVFDSKSDDVTKAKRVHDLIFKEKYLLSPNVVIYTSTKISNLNLTSGQLNAFFEGLTSDVNEMISFIAFGKIPSVATFSRMIQEPELYSHLMQLFHGGIPAEKPAWFDNLWTAFATHPDNMIEGMLSELSKGLDHEWVQQAFVKASAYDYQHDYNPFNIFFDSGNEQEVPLDGTTKFYPFAWDHFNELSLRRTIILQALGQDFKQVYHSSLNNNENLRATALISVLEKILSSTPDAELIPVFEGNRDPASILFFIAVVLNQDTTKTRSGELYKTLWAEVINDAHNGTDWELHRQMNWLFTQIGVAGETKIKALYARLNLGDAAIRQSNQILDGLVVDTSLLDADFKAANIYFRQMEIHDDEDKLGARFPFLDVQDMQDHLGQLSNNLDIFCYDMTLAVELVVNPKSPQEQQDKRGQLLDRIDRWLTQTPSDYMKTVLLAWRWQLDSSTDLKAVYETRDRFARDDSSLPAFDRKYYDISLGWPRQELTDFLNSKNPPKVLNPENNSHGDVTMNQADVLFFENEPPDGTNHASVVKSVFESNSLRAFGGKANGGGNVVNRVYETLNQLNFDQLPAKVVSFSIGDFTNEISSLSKKDAEKILASPEGIKLKEKLETLSSKGVVVVASAGNDRENFSTAVLNQLSILSLFSPPLCLVAAANENGSIANYSSQGSYNIRPTITGYSHMPGTSFSGPAVASIATKMSQIPSALTGKQKVLIMMMATQKLPRESRMSQGTGLANESRSLWLTYYFSAPHTEDELATKAQELGLRLEIDWLKYLVKEHGDDLLQNPDELWHKLLFK